MCTLARSIIFSLIINKNAGCRVAHFEKFRGHFAHDPKIQGEYIALIRGQSAYCENVGSRDTHF